MVDMDELQKRLKTVADIVNSFKSEAVQLRVVDALLAQLGTQHSPAIEPADALSNKRRKRSGGRGKSKTDASTAKTRSAPFWGSGPGSFAMISELLDSGFFKQPKTIGAIVAHCGTTRGHHYKANECSTPLLRLLRDGKLTRKKNVDNHYDFTEA